MRTLSITDHDLAEMRRLAPLVQAGPQLTDGEGTWCNRAGLLAQMLTVVLAEDAPPCDAAEVWIVPIED